MKKVTRWPMFALLAMSINACSLVDKIAAFDAASTPVPPAKLYAGSSVSGAWTPSVSSAGLVANSKGTVTTTTIALPLQTGVGMVRFQDPWGSKEVTVDLGSFDATTDFGYDGAGHGNGSITLTADAINYPYSGGAYPVLTSFQVVGATTTEFVNVSSGCNSGGMYTCSGGVCDANPSCTVTTTGAGSSFFNRDDWDQHQTPPYGYTSVNSFPRCDATVGGWNNCPATFNKLPSGHYYAKYILLSDRGVSVSTGSANLQVKLTIKKDTAARNIGSTNGAINLNVVLVGSKNIGDSHTAKGAQNLNLLFEEVNRILKKGSSISIGDIKVYEWRDADRGDYYSQIDYSLLGELFSAGSQGIPAQDEGKMINIFMVKDIQITGVNYSILGLAGAILGPPVNGSQSSGLAFSTNINLSGVLSGFNASCSAGSCPRDSQDGSFLEMGATIAHELGHYLGLNHPSEKVANINDVQRHDQLTDTPTCAPRAGPYLDQRSCYEDTALQKHYSGTPATQACATACDAYINTNIIPNGKYRSNGAKTNYYCDPVEECQFNHVMWYTTKLRAKVNSVWNEDGNQFSPASSALIQWNPFVK